MEPSKIVPQLFYDLIGRVVPGAFALIVISFAIGQNLAELFVWPFATVKPLRYSSLVLSIVFLGASYLAGHLLSPFSDLVRPSLAGVMSHHFGILESVLQGSNRRYKAEAVEFLCHEAGFTKDDTLSEHDHISALIYVWADWLQVVEPSVGARLAKLRAECRLFSETTVAALIGVLVYIAVVVAGRSQMNSLFVGVCLAVTFIAAWNYARMYRLFQWSLINKYYVVKQTRPGFREGATSET